MAKRKKGNGDEYMPLVRSLTDEGLSSLSQAVERGLFEREYGSDTYDGLAAAFGRLPICPSCKIEAHEPYAYRKGNGQPLYRCSGCGSVFTLVSGTVLNSSKIEPWRMGKVIRLMTHNASLDEIADVAGVHHNTALLIRRKVFETVAGWQAKVKLYGRVFIDEIYTFDSAMPKDHFGKNKRGLNSSKCCIFLAVDKFKNMIAFLIGHGKPTKAEVKKALLPHLAKGVELIIHDGEKAHKEAVSESGAADEVHLSAKKTEEDLTAMLLINSFCSWVQKYLASFTGMDTEYLQDYLNWFVYLFKCRSDSEKWPVVKRILRHMLLEDASLIRADCPSRKKEKREELSRKGRVYKPKNVQVTQKSERFRGKKHRIYRD